MFLGWQAAWVFSFDTGKTLELRMWRLLSLAFQAAPVSHRETALKESKGGSRPGL